MFPQSQGLGCPKKPSEMAGANACALSGMLWCHSFEGLLVMAYIPKLVEYQ